MNGEIIPVNPDMGRIMATTVAYVWGGGVYMGRGRMNGEGGRMYGEGGVCMGGICMGRGA